MKKKRRDGDFVPDLEEDDFESPAKKKRIAESFLTKNQGEVWELQSLGSKPAAIAGAICAKHGLPKSALNGKQVSNWVSYHKKSGKHGTRKVSLQNDNLRPDRSDNCANIFLF
jgi:hypothetical protein